MLRLRILVAADGANEYARSYVCALEVTRLSGAHEVTGWNDKEYVHAGTEERAKRRSR